jgi:uncharacterized coiled-coil protein SlyX
MDISQETDIDKLKSLAYDQILALENAQQNLRVLNERIAQVNAPAQAEN